MSKTTDLPFNGGAIVVPSGETTSAQVHTVFLRKITITDAGHESQIYAMFDMNKPKTTAPFFEPVSAFNLAEWCVRGDVVQVDLSEAMSQGTDRYAGVLQDVVLSNDAESGIYVSACTLRTMTTYDSDTIRLSWFSLYLIMDQETSVSYLATPEYGSPTMMDVPDHKVKIGEGYSQESPNYLPYKIMGDNSTVRVDIVSQNGLGQPIDPFLRISTIGSSGDGKVLADYIDDNRDYLVNKVSGSGGIVAQVKAVDGYRYVEIAPDPEAQDPLARMSDLEAIVESRILENLPIGAATSEISQLAESTGKLTMSLCHSNMDFELRKAHSTVNATKATVYITNCNSTQKLRVVVFQPIYTGGVWRYALVACSSEVVIQDLVGNGYDPSDPNNLDSGGVLSVDIDTVYDGPTFNAVADYHMIKSTDDVYVGIVATGTSLGAVGSHINNGGTVNTQSSRLVAEMSNVNAHWDPDDYESVPPPKDIDVNNTFIANGNRVYVELHNARGA